MRQAASKIKALTSLRPGLGLVLGSGFGSVLDEIEEVAVISYAKLPGFPQPTVAGHAGKLVIGKLAGVPVMALSGRAHFYEGHSMERVTFAVRTLAACGVCNVLLTNAAGGINRRFRVGDFMLLTDHINFMGVNPLRGAFAPVSELTKSELVKGPTNSPTHLFTNSMRFVDLTQAYDPSLSRMLVRAARSAKVKLHRGVYLAVSGPSYETPAEIRAFKRLGADAVGMSTVPEVIVARQLGLRVVALSCITNLAAGISKTSLSHDDVLDVGKRVHARATALTKQFAKLYAKV